jgi:hypothetical protein
MCAEPKLIIVEPLPSLQNKVDPPENPANTGTEYRGADRIKLPAFQREELGDDSELNKLLAWYLTAGAESSEGYGVVDNLENVRSLIRLWREYADIEYDALELTVDNEEPKVGGEFLGYDVLNSGFGDSLLKKGPEPGYGRQVVVANHPKLQAFLRRTYPLAILIKRYFQPRLNVNGLFNSYKVAKFYLACETALASTPDTNLDWESLGYQVVGTYKVPIG